MSLPDYYDAINKNASYQLTAVGAAMPNLYIEQEIENGKFIIAGGVAGKKVSWQLTAERNDPYMQQYPEKRNMVVDKGEKRGTYMMPELYGKSADQGMYSLSSRTKAGTIVKDNTHAIENATQQAELSKDGIVEARNLETSKVETVKAAEKTRKTKEVTKAETETEVNVEEVTKKLRTTSDVKRNTVQPSNE